MERYSPKRILKERRLYQALTVITLILILAGFQCNQPPSPAPVITNAAPSVIPVRSSALKVTVYGSGFDQGAQLLWAGSPRSTVVFSPTQLTASILATDLTKTGPVLIQVAQNSSVSNSFTITITPAQLVISGTSCPAGQVGVAYSCTLAASGGVAPYTWTATGTLPPGLTLSSAGVISGTPSQFGSFTFTITVTDSAGSLPARIKVNATTNKS